MFESCLICTDLQDGLHRLIEFIPSLGISGLKKIVFFHSVPYWEEGNIPRVDEEKIAKAKIILNKAVEKVGPEIEVTVAIEAGKPLETIGRFLAANRVDLIITGSPVRSILQEKFIGSTSSGLAKLTTTPIAILRPQLLCTYTREELDLRCQHLWRDILIPYNDSSTAKFCLEKIKKLAIEKNENFFKKIILMWVIDDSGRQDFTLEYRLKEAREKLNLIKSDLETSGLQVQIELKEGNPLQEILTAALHSDISAIAIATDRRANIIEWTIPSFANELLHRSWFPILFFPPQP
jgi:nucleotide-binding universal stress UspA family protein